MNRLGIVQGSGVDSSLNEKGKEQANAFFETYQSIDFQVIITSKLKRTKETVASFIEKGIPHYAFAEINEMGWGIHEGKTGTPEMREDYLQTNEAWINGDFTPSVEGGESALALKKRLERFVNMLKKRSEKTILICSHGRAISGLMCVLKELSFTEMKQFKTHNTALYLADFIDGKFIFEKENDQAHLELINTE